MRLRDSGKGRFSAQGQGRRSPAGNQTSRRRCRYNRGLPSGKERSQQSPRRSESAVQGWPESALTFATVSPRTYLRSKGRTGNPLAVFFALSVDFLKKDDIGLDRADGLPYLGKNKSGAPRAETLVGIVGENSEMSSLHPGVPPARVLSQSQRVYQQLRGSGKGRNHQRRDPQPDPVLCSEKGKRRAPTPIRVAPPRRFGSSVRRSDWTWT
jgi:hypothetical protein